MTKTAQPVKVELTPELLKEKPQIFDELLLSELDKLNKKLHQYYGTLNSVVGEELKLSADYRQRVERELSEDELNDQRVQIASQAKKNLVAKLILQLENSGEVTPNAWRQLTTFISLLEKEIENTGGDTTPVTDEIESTAFTNLEPQEEGRLTISPPPGLNDADKSLFKDAIEYTVERFHEPKFRQGLHYLQSFVSKSHRALDKAYREAGKIARIGQSQILLLVGACLGVLTFDLAIYSEFAKHILGYTGIKIFLFALVALVAAKLIGRLIFLKPLREALESNQTERRLPFKSLMIALSFILVFGIAAGLYSSIAIQNEEARIERQTEEMLARSIVQGISDQSDIVQDYESITSTEAPNGITELAPVPAYLQNMYSISVPVILLSLALLTLLAGGYFLSELELRAPIYLMKRRLTRLGERRIQLETGFDRLIKARDGIIAQLADLNGFQALYEAKQKAFNTFD